MCRPDPKYLTEEGKEAVGGDGGQRGESGVWEGRVETRDGQRVELPSVWFT